jgi:hypothetical protein
MGCSAGVLLVVTVAGAGVGVDRQGCMWHLDEWMAGWQATIAIVSQAVSGSHAGLFAGAALRQIESAASVDAQVRAAAGVYARVAACRIAVP